MGRYSCQPGHFTSCSAAATRATALAASPFQSKPRIRLPWRPLRLSAPGTICLQAGPRPAPGDSRVPLRRAAGDTGVDVVEAGAEALPFADGAFDAALSQLVVNFMRDGEAGVREMARVTRPGGIVASCVWDYSGEMTLLRAFWDAAREIDPERGAAADEGVVMRWCAEGELAELWRAAGLGSVRFGSLVASAKYADFEDLWSPLPTGVGPAGAFCKSLEDDDRAALRDAFRRRLGVGDGPFELTASAWSVVGRVPS
jgi:SAM-dependent methyltransferase